MSGSALGPALLVAVAVAGAVAVTVVLRRRRRDVWRSFAARHGLALGSDDEGRPRVEGAVGGRPVTVSLSRESSDTGVLGVEVVELAVGTVAPAPETLAVRRLPLAGEVVEEEASVETGDERFDRLAEVRCDQPDAARDFLDPQRREALAALLDLDAAAGLAGGRLYVRRRRAVARLGSLEADLALLRRTAERLES